MGIGIGFGYCFPVHGIGAVFGGLECHSSTHITNQSHIGHGYLGGGAGAAGIGGGAETEPDTEDTRNKVSIKSTEAGSPNITATGGGVLNDEIAGAAAIGSGSVAGGATDVKSAITIEGKVTIDATAGGSVAIGDAVTGEQKFDGLSVGTAITRKDSDSNTLPPQEGDKPPISAAVLLSIHIVMSVGTSGLLATTLINTKYSIAEILTPPNTPTNHFSRGV